MQVLEVYCGFGGGGSALQHSAATSTEKERESSALGKVCTTLESFVCCNCIERAVDRSTSQWKSAPPVDAVHSSPEYKRRRRGVPARKRWGKGRPHTSTSPALSVSMSMGSVCLDDESVSLLDFGRDAVSSHPDYHSAACDLSPFARTHQREHVSGAILGE